MAAPSTLLDAITDPAVGQPEEYPYSDGKVLMETDPHARSIIDMRDQLDTHFKARKDVYVAGSMAVYYRQGDRATVVVPDVFVVEVASTSTSRRDASSKRATYERMGVPEYWRFDPLGELIPGRLEGWRLEGGRYERVRAVRAAGWHRSEALGLELQAERWLLRFRDPLRGREMLTHAEISEELEVSVRERDEATRRAEAEATRRLTAEQEREAANQRIRELEARLRVADTST